MGVGVDTLVLPLSRLAIDTPTRRAHHVARPVHSLHLDVACRDRLQTHRDALILVCLYGSTPLKRPRKMLSVLKLSCSIFLLLTLRRVGTAIPLANFYPFGEANNDSRLLPNDDGSSEQIFFDRPFPFFGSRHTSLYVSLC